MSDCDNSEKLQSFLFEQSLSWKMEPELLRKGEQIFYSNQFEQLTYNTDMIIQMTSQLSQTLKKFSNAFSSKDSSTIINKNLTAFLFWFVLDSLYYSQQISYEVDRINYLRKKRSSKSVYHSSYPGPYVDDLNFIIKLRLLLMNRLNMDQKFILTEIRNSSIDLAIQSLEEEYDKKVNQNDQKIEQMVKKVESQKQYFTSKLTKHQIQPQQGCQLFSYYNFEKQMIRNWMDQIQNKKIKPKCQVCSRTDRIIKCQKCNMYVHPHCYPKLFKYQQYKSFICQNCQKGLTQQTECIFCPNKGGYFLQVDNSAKKMVYYVINRKDGLKITFKRKQRQQERSFIHLSCYLWHSQLHYNIEKKKITNIHQVDRKKSQNACYQCGTNIGVTIPCANQNCRRYFHPQCGKKIDLGTCIINAKNKLLIELYCERHRRAYIYQIMRENILSNLKQLRKLFEGLDHEIKRLNNNTIDRKYQPKPIYEEPQVHEGCMYCGKQHPLGSKEPIKNCERCYNWYHQACGTRCKICIQS